MCRFYAPNEPWSCLFNKICLCENLLLLKNTYDSDSKRRENYLLICEVEIVLIYLWVRYLLWSTFPL
jgi:hypothetical protein